MEREFVVMLTTGARFRFLLDQFIEDDQEAVEAAYDMLGEGDALFGSYARLHRRDEAEVWTKIDPAHVVSVSCAPSVSEAGERNG